MIIVNLSVKKMLLSCYGKCCSRFLNNNLSTKIKKLEYERNCFGPTGLHYRKSVLEAPVKTRRQFRGCSYIAS